MNFNKILTHTGIQSFLKENNLVNLTDIQEKVIPEILKGKSVNVIAKTGSGKTLTFALPIVEQLKFHEEATDYDISDKKNYAGKPKAIVLAPTRELANQLHKVFKSIAHHAKLRVRILAGGEGAKTNHLLSRDVIDVLIATPGRLSSAIKRKEITLKSTQFLIMDEADQLLDMGFRKDLINIYQSCDQSLVHIGLFSATHSDSLDEFLKTTFFDIDFENFNKEDRNKIALTIRTFNIYVTEKEKIPMTEAFVKNESKGMRGIIFVNKHETVDLLLNELKTKFSKIKFHGLHGEMEALERKKSYDRFLKEGGILISTDITARGMHIDDLVWVMNFDLPFEAVYYIHRCGRVGRNAKDGFVYNLVIPKDMNIAARINEAIKNQTALKLTSFDERKFKKLNPTDKKEIKTKLEKKKTKLDELKNKVGNKKAPKKHVRTIKVKNTPRYKKSKGKK